MQERHDIMKQFRSGEIKARVIYQRALQRSAHCDGAYNVYNIYHGCNGYLLHRAQVLVATDVAARGLDIKAVKCARPPYRSAPATPRTREYLCRDTRPVACIRVCSSLTML